MFRLPASLTSISIMLLTFLTTAASGAIYVDDDGAGNFTKIQDAINASETGEVVIVQDGTYPENLVVDRSVVLKGEGGAVVEGSGLSAPLITVTSENVTLEGLTFAGCLNDSFDAGAVLVLADGCKILNSSIADSSGHGLYLRDSRDHLVSGNLIRDNRLGGVYVFGANFSQITGNRVFSNGKWGIALDHCEYDALMENEVRENGEVGVQLVGSFYTQVLFNRIGLNAEDGVHLMESMDTAILENEIKDNGLNGVNLEHAPNNFLLNNVIQGSGEEGLLVIGFSDDNIIIGNTLYENGINGIGIYRSYSGTLSQNVIFDNEYNGVSLRDNSSNILISDNEIHGNKRYGCYLEESDKNYVEGNDVHGNLHGVIVARSSDSVLEDNKIHDNRFGLGMEFSDTASITGNDLYNNSDHAVQLMSCDRSKVWENRIRENGGDGVHVLGSENLLASRNIIENNSKYGIQMLDRTAQTTFMYNLVQQNDEGGIYIYEGNINLITGNIFVDNQNFNARDNGENNRWIANFYSDYSGEAIAGGVVGTEPYPIQGRRGAVTLDLSPVVVKAWLEARGAH